jgi:hypothetical protein
MKILKNKSKFQKTHHPIRKEIVKCDGELLDSYCQKCGRAMQNRQNGKYSHNAYMHSLGIIYYYSNGTAYWEKPTKESIDLVISNIQFLKKINRIR